MDRRQRKTKAAIFKAFISLLSQKDYYKITVSEIIEAADIGRATFYAHFETKDFLLKELCEELFCHVLTYDKQGNTNSSQLFDCSKPDTVFLHLLRHLQNNDNQILELLVGRNNELFLRYFKNQLANLVQNEFTLQKPNFSKPLPDDYFINHISSTFVETVRWWKDNHDDMPPEQIHEYFLHVTQLDRVI